MTDEQKLQEINKEFIKKHNSLCTKFGVILFKKHNSTAEEKSAYLEASIQFEKIRIQLKDMEDIVKEKYGLNL